MKKPTSLHRLYPRIPRRRDAVIGLVLNWGTALALTVVMGWLAAQAF